MPSMASSKERMPWNASSATGSPKMTTAFNGMLPVAPAPRGSRSRIPLVGEMLDARAEAAFQAAFDRSEHAVIAEMQAHGDVLVYTHCFDRVQRNAPRNISLSVGLPATIGASGIVAAGLGAPPLLAGASFALAAAAAGVALARAGWPAGTTAAGARLAAICSLSIIVAAPSRRGATVRRIPLGSIRGVAREPRGAVIRLAGEEIVLDGLSNPKRFVDEARRCIDEDSRRLRRAEEASMLFKAAGLERDACEVAAIRLRLRERGWMLAVANDYRLKGEWHVFYSFTHPDGIAAKGEGTSDLAALRLAEADVLATEDRLRSLKERAA